MDTNDTEYDMLDLLAFNCNQLSSKLRETKHADEQEKILETFLNKIDDEFEPINEIAEGLSQYDFFFLDILTLAKEKHSF